MKTIAMTLPAMMTIGGFGLKAMFAVASERRRLGQLSPHMLRDLGLSEDDAVRESARPFWDLPANRRV